MNQPLERVIKNLNPLHDYDGIRFHNLSIDSLPSVVLDDTNPLPTLVELGKRGLKDLYPIIYFPKSMVRGGLAGGVVGTLVSLASGDSPREGFAVGSTLGALADLLQFYFRYPYYYRKQMEQEIGNREPIPNTST